MTQRIQRRLDGERERFERSRAEVEALAGEEHEELRTALEGKLSSAEDRLALQRAQREGALSRGRDDQRQRCVGQRDKARGIETQLEEWRKEVELYNQMVGGWTSGYNAVCNHKSDDCLLFLPKPRTGSLL